VQEVQEVPPVGGSNSLKAASLFLDRMGSLGEPIVRQHSSTIWSSTGEGREFQPNLVSDLDRDPP